MIADSGNWDIGVPALTTSLRGLVRLDIEVRTLAHAVHSGMWGGLVPDALMTLARVLSSLHDDAGDVAVPGSSAGRPPRWSTPRSGCAPSPARRPASSGSAPARPSSGSGPAVDQHHRPGRPEGRRRQQHAGPRRPRADLDADRAG